MSPQELQVQEKRELEKKEESTAPARYFIPTTDIFETEEALSLIVEMPGVDKSKVDVSVEDGVLTIEGQLGSGPGAAQGRGGQAAPHQSGLMRAREEFRSAP